MIDFKLDFKARRLNVYMTKDGVRLLVGEIPFIPYPNAFIKSDGEAVEEK